MVDAYPSLKAGVINFYENPALKCGVTKDPYTSSWE
jgi:hypothetical protein